MSNYKRIAGKDLHVTWPVTVNGGEIPLSECKLTLHVIDPWERVFTLPVEVSADGSAVQFVFPGTLLNVAGDYTFVIWSNFGEKGQTLTDTVNALTLVDHAYEEANPEAEDSNISVDEPIVLDAGDLQLGGFVDTSKIEESIEALAQAIAEKADKATTLGGYGITDAKIEADMSGMFVHLGDMIARIPSKTSHLNNDSGFITSSAISDMETKEHAAQTYQPKGNYLTQHQDISEKADRTYVNTELAKKANTSEVSELRNTVNAGVTSASNAAQESAEAAEQAQRSAAESESRYGNILNAMQNLPDGSAVSAQVALNKGKLSELEEKIGYEASVYAKTDGGTFAVGGFSSKVILRELSIPKGKTIKIEINGSAVRNTQRLYINRSGGGQIAIPATADVSINWTATEDVDSLYYAAAVTTEGSLSMTVSYDVPASGVTEVIGRFEKAYPAITQVVGEIVDTTERKSPTWALGANGNAVIYDYVTKSDNCTLTCVMNNVVGDYSSVRMAHPLLDGVNFLIMQKRSDGSYFGSVSLIGLPKGSVISIRIFTDATHTGSSNGSCDIEMQEQSYSGNGYPRVDIFTSDSQIDIFKKLLYANNVGHCDVHFQTGTYYFNETLYDWMRSERMSGRAELPIGGGCRYFFNGATLVGSYAGTDTYVHQNCNVIGCGLTSGNYELHDGTIIANDICYGIHDDCGLNGHGEHHVHKYHNMRVVYNGGAFARNNAICKCIGGGTSRNISVIIDGCVLEKYTENSNKDCVTYHGFATNPSSAQHSRIMITNTWMNGACGAYHLVNAPRNETIEFVVSNCRTNLGNVAVDKLFAWNNEPIS